MELRQSVNSSTSSKIAWHTVHDGDILDCKTSHISLKVAVIGIGEVFVGEVAVDDIVTVGPSTSDAAINQKKK